ncbi:hypothetical protein [Oceanomicrobium pacificus]|nr:hypothetical protein [Oceanomicrobium pacificus]
MGTILKFLMFLLVLAGLAFVAYAVIMPLPAPERDVVIPLDVTSE